MRTKKMPGKLAHAAAILVTFVLMLVMTLGCLCWLAEDVLTNAEMHASIALDQRVTDAQMQAIDRQVTELAQAQPFQKETVMNIVTRESVEQYNREVIAWWLGLMQADPTVEAPTFDTGDVQAAVREDPVFLENVPSSRRRAVARDDIAYEVGRAVEKAVLPVRTDVLAILLPPVLQRVDVPSLMNYFALLPMLCGIAAGALALLVLLVMLRRPSKALMYMGAGLGASALCMAGVGAAAYLLGITAYVAELSPVLAMQVSLLTKQIALRAGVYAACTLVLGWVLIGIHQHDMKRIGKSWRVMNG